MERRSFAEQGAGAEPGGGSGFAGSGFVGRGPELRRLREVLAAGACVVVVRGEAGTGVSRLVDEALGHPAFTGWAQLRGGCPQPASGAAAGGVRSGAVADAPADGLADALAEALAGLPYRPSSQARLPALTGVVGLIVPELADRLPEPPASAADPEVRRALLPRAIRVLLAVQGDTVLVIEDVHRADAAGLELLHRLIESMPPRLRVVVTERVAPGLPLFGVRVPPRVRVAEVGVRPWTPEETGAFVRRWVGERAYGEEPGLAGLVHRRTAGHPGAAEALLAEAAGGAMTGAADRGAVAAEADPAPAPVPVPVPVSVSVDVEETVPGRVRRTEPDPVREAGADGVREAGALLDAVARGLVPVRVRREWAWRWGRLTEDARRVVQAAAVLDRAASVGVLAEVAGLEPARGEDAAALAVRHAVLREEGPCLVFRHPLDR
ncbi:hypothetical protein C6N75_27410, partial [Streptomyces solincola]